jgi:deoxyribose-phosphate aldolase
MKTGTANTIDLHRIAKTRLDARAIAREAAGRPSGPVDPHVARADLMRAVSLMDLAALSDDETPETVRAVCIRALSPLPGARRVDGIHAAAVCVYARHLSVAKEVLDGSGVKRAAVAGNFPRGRMPVAGKVDEIRCAIDAGAEEVDVVITRALALRGDWRALYDEIAAFREACGQITLKVILKTGALQGLRRVAIASRIAMAAGADFIKTSTGKERVNATLPAGLVMAREIRQHEADSGRAVGLKPAGGIRTPEQALQWLALVRHELGEHWLTPALFRIGASALLAAIDRQLTSRPVEFALME